MDKIHESANLIGEAIELYRFRDAMSEMIELARVGNKYLADTEPWKLIKTDEEGVKKIMYVAIQCVGALTTLMQPFLPFASKKMENMLGLMKAVGATNRDVLSIFLGEAAGIGFIGGLGGIVIGWLAAQAMNVLEIVYLAGQASQQGGAPPSVAVYTPIWLPVFALIFSTFIGMLSGLYPALRAATMIPVQALKYE